jgi:myosin heavy subunit
MQLLTSLNYRKNDSIEEKILACNPVLEAFGNSKTVKN